MIDQLEVPEECIETVQQIEKNALIIRDKLSVPDNENALWNTSNPSYDSEHEAITRAMNKIFELYDTKPAACRLASMYMGCYACKRCNLKINVDPLGPDVS